MTRRMFAPLFFTLILFIGLSSQAYISTMDTGEILPAGKYRALGNLQYLSDPSGGTINGGFDAGVDQSSNIRVLAGVGSVVHVGAFFKWVPFPDTPKQPAIGIMAGGSWARWGGENYPSARAYPIVSKKFDAEIGKLIPYASLPFGVVAGPRKNTFPLNLAAGTEWYPNGVENFTFLLELGLSINESANYVTLGVMYYLPE